MIPSIYTYKGHYFDFTRPDENVIDIEDIAHALARICRFTGHIRRFLSVAEHSVLCSYLVPKEYALHALAHDFEEAYCGDVSSPLKQLLPDYKAIVKPVAEAIFKRFGLPTELPECVHRADLQMLLLEKQAALGYADQWEILEGVQFPLVALQFWKPNKAERMLLARFFELTNSDNKYLQKDRELKRSVYQLQKEKLKFDLREWNV